MIYRSQARMFAENEQCWKNRNQYKILYPRGHFMIFKVLCTPRTPYIIEMGIAFGNWSSIPNLLRRVFHSQIKIKCMKTWENHFQHYFWMRLENQCSKFKLEFRFHSFNPLGECRKPYLHKGHNHFSLISWWWLIWLFIISLHSSTNYILNTPA